MATPIDPKNCPSTHGGSGYPPQTVVSPDGKLRCPFCGTEMNPAAWKSGQAHYIDENMGAPKPESPQQGGFFNWLAGVGAAILGEAVMVEPARAKVGLTRSTGDYGNVRAELEVPYPRVYDQDPRFVPSIRRLEPRQQLTEAYVLLSDWLDLALAAEALGRKLRYAQEDVDYASEQHTRALEVRQRELDSGSYDSGPSETKDDLLQALRDERDRLVVARDLIKEKRAGILARMAHPPAGVTGTGID